MCGSFGHTWTWAGTNMPSGTPCDCGLVKHRNGSSAPTVEIFTALPGTVLDTGDIHRAPLLARIDALEKKVARIVENRDMIFGRLRSRLYHRRYDDGHRCDYRAEMEALRASFNALVGETEEPAHADD
jgi:hypothetical protein